MTGLVGRALVIMLEFFRSTMMPNENPWRPTHKIIAMIIGRGVLEEMSLFSFSIVGAALVLHLVSGVLVSMVLGAIIASFYFDSSPDMLMIVDVVSGIIARVVSSYGMTAVFPWFVSERGSGPPLANLLLGVTTTITHDMPEQCMPGPMH